MVPGSVPCASAHNAPSARFSLRHVLRLPSRRLALQAGAQRGPSAALLRGGHRLQVEELHLSCQGVNPNTGKLVKSFERLSTAQLQHAPATARTCKNTYRADRAAGGRGVDTAIEAVGIPSCASGLPEPPLPPAVAPHLGEPRLLERQRERDALHTGGPEHRHLRGLSSADRAPARAIRAPAATRARSRR